MATQFELLDGLPHDIYTEGIVGRGLHSSVQKMIHDGGRAMRFAISIPQHVPDGTFDPARLRDYLGRAEELGFHSAWTLEAVLRPAIPARAIRKIVIKMTPEAFHTWSREFHMSEATDTNTAPGMPSALLVAAGQDRFGDPCRLGINTIDFKVTSQESTGLLIVEVTSHAKGGPERHLHVAQDEWFYVLEGQFLIEVAAERFRLTSGTPRLAERR